MMSTPHPQPQPRHSPPQQSSPNSPLARLDRMERVMGEVIIPRLAYILHELRVQNRIVTAMMDGRRPTAEEISRMVAEEVRTVERDLPGVHINYTPRDPSLHAP